MIIMICVERLEIKHPYITTTSLTKSLFYPYKYFLYSVGFRSLSCGVVYVHCSVNNYTEY